jgi:histone deacetylase 6
MVIKKQLDELEEDLMSFATLGGNDGEESHGGQRFLQIQPRHATRSEVELVHTPEHYDYLKSVSGSPHEELLEKTNEEEDSKDLVWNEHTFDAALLAAGCAIECVDKVTKRDGGCTRAISVTRPPGHHASAGSAGGFCFLNNIALAAQYALSNGRAKRVVIFDPDIHHGNGTQDITYDNENIFFISLHRYEVDKENEYSFYPGTGQPNECGST